MLAAIIAEHPNEELTVDDITKLAATRINREWLDAFRDTAVKKLFSQILNRSKIKREDGSTVRKFQSYTKFVQTDEGRERQLNIWKDIDSMSYAQMVIVAKERKRHIEDSRASLTNDLDYWNTNVRKPGERKIQLDF